MKGYFGLSESINLIASIMDYRGYKSYGEGAHAAEHDTYYYAYINVVPYYVIVYMYMYRYFHNTNLKI